MRLNIQSTNLVLQPIYRRLSKENRRSSMLLSTNINNCLWPSHDLSTFNTGFQQPQVQIQKKRRLSLHPHLEVVGRTRIMEISLSPRKARAKSRIVTIILYPMNFLRSQTLSITSYCRYIFPLKSYRHPALRD